VLPPPDAVLILIDVQHAIDDPSWGRRNNAGAEGNVLRLLERWRDRGRTVIHVRHVSREAGSTFRPGQRGVDFKEPTAPRDGELVVTKHTPSAFAGTDLERLLRATPAGASVIVVGFITNNSVETTARVAATLGFAVWVVSDATATFDRRDLEGRAWQAEEVHALSLANMSGEYATIVKTDDLLRAL
jgi:nicotinamidase-related amidase